MHALDEIPFELDMESLAKKVRVEPDSDDSKAFAGLVQEAGRIARPKAVYKECFIDEKRHDGAVTMEGIKFHSRTLRRNLERTERVFAFVATCGRELDGLPLPEGDMLAEFWRDTIKAVLLSAAMRYLDEHLARRYRLGRNASMSPGSGDADTWPIEQQKELFSLLGGTEAVRNAAGVELTDSFLMVPNKSVSGIRFPTESDFRSCQVCHRENCPSRSAPFDDGLWQMMQHE